jgi:hemerythrin-like domain-containing protein
MKHRKEFLLDESIIDYLEAYKDENHSSSGAAALTAIIEEHKHRNDISATKVLVDALAKQVAEELKDTLTRIRLGSNNADRNSEVILLLLNTLLSYSGYKSLIDKDTEQLLKAKQIVKDRIANYRQRKIDKEKPETSPPIFTDDDFTQ